MTANYSVIRAPVPLPSSLVANKIIKFCGFLDKKEALWATYLTRTLGTSGQQEWE